jgi:hypothetical protein
MIIRNNSRRVRPSRFARAKRITTGAVLGIATIAATTTSASAGPGTQPIGPSPTPVSAIIDRRDYSVSAYYNGSQTRPGFWSVLVNVQASGLRPSPTGPGPMVSFMISSRMVMDYASGISCTPVNQFVVDSPSTCTARMRPEYGGGPGRVGAYAAILVPRSVLVTISLGTPGGGPFQDFNMANNSVTL